MSNKPEITIELAAKKGDRKIKVLALWRSRQGYAGSYSAGNAGWQVYDKDTGESVDVVKMVLADGRTIKLADYYTNGTHWGEKQDARGGQDEQPPIPFGDDSEDSGIPF